MDECFYVLSPVPNLKGSADWKTNSEKFKNFIYDKLEKSCLPNLKDNILISDLFLGSHTFLFVSIFSLGLIGVIVFYVYKKSSGSFGDGRYQYSVLNSNLMDPDDDSNDPLINDFGRNDEDDTTRILVANKT